MFANQSIASRASDMSPSAPRFSSDSTRTPVPRTPYPSRRAGCSCSTAWRITAMAASRSSRLALSRATHNSATGTTPSPACTQLCRPKPQWGHRIRHRTWRSPTGQFRTMRTPRTVSQRPPISGSRPPDCPRIGGSPATGGVIDLGVTRCLLPTLDHRVGPVDVSFVAKRFRHFAIATHQVSIGNIVTVGPG
jgi:hypothetical protein